MHIADDRRRIYRCKVKGLDKQQLCIDLLMVGSWSAKEQPGGSLDSIQDIYGYLGILWDSMGF